MKHFLSLSWRRAAAITIALAVAIGAPAIAVALTSTTVSISASPSPAVAGQPVTLTATPSVPGTVTFSFGGSVVGTAETAPAGAAVPAAQTWSYTGNSSAWRLAVDSSNNIYVSTYNPTDCGGGRCQTKQLTPGGAVNYAPSESWNGTYVSVIGLAVASNGKIYEAVYNGSAQNSIRVRTSIGATSSQFVSPTDLGVAAAGQGQISGMTIDSSDNLYITMPVLGMIKKITPAGVVSTYASGLGSPISSPAINNTTGVLYFINGSKDIMQIAAGGGAATLLTAASCNMDVNPASSWYGLGAQLALDSAGNIYGAQCAGVTPASSPNNEPITQINPTTGAMREYLSWSTCMNGSLPNWAAGCGGSQALAFVGNKMATAGANMSESNVMVLGPSGYVATFVYTPPTSGSFATGAALAPTDSGTYAGSNGSGTLVVRPAAPSTPDLAAASDLGTSSTDNLTSDTTPRIEVPGTYTSGDTITVTATKAGSANVTCTYVIPATGCDLGTLAAGVWSITATDTNPTGGTSAASGALSITVDATAPTAPTGVDLAVASDTGSSSSDNITSDSTPTMSASGGSTGDTMTLTATKAGQADVTCSYVLPASSCDLGTLADGTWSVTARLTDPAGNTSTASSPLSITVDTAGATGVTPDLVAASDLGGSSTDNLTSDNTPTITIPGQATGDVITITATKAGSADVTCTYSVGSPTNCTLPTMADGTWSVTASITDLAGNAGTTQALNITIDTTAPSAPSAVDLLAASDLGTSSTDNITSDNTPAVSASGGTFGDTMTLTATKAGQTDVTCTYVLPASSCDLGTLADGVWSVTAKLTDPAGNTSTASAPLSITIDTAAPSAPSAVDLTTASDTGTSTTDNLTGDNTPAISVPGVSAGDLVTVTATRGGVTLSCTYTQGLATSCDLPTLDDGTWSISATATDAAGNASTLSSPLSVTVDTVGPTGPGQPAVAPASDSGSSNSDGVTNDTTPTIVVPGAATGDTITVAATKDGVTLTCTFVAAPGVDSCTLPALGPGDWRIVASSDAVDGAGNPAPPSTPGHLTIDTVNPAPALPDLAPASDTGASSTDDITKDTTPTIDIPGVKPGSTVTVVATQPGKPSVTCTFVASATVTGCDLPFLSDGTWNITASSVDPAGNQSPASAPLSIFLDTAPPAPPATPTIPAKPSNPALGPVQDLGGNTRPIVGVDGGTPGDTITVIGTKGGITVTCSFVVGQATSCQLPTLGSGQWTITAKATDPAGNASGASAGISVRVAGRTASTASARRPLLRLVAVSSRHTLRARQQTVITLRARNVGQTVARHVTMRVRIPVGLAVVGQRALAITGGELSFTTASLNPGSTATRQVTVVATSVPSATNVVVRARVSATAATARTSSVVHHVLPSPNAGRGTGGAAVTG